jgi:hypothetical protein
MYSDEEMKRCQHKIQEQGRNALERFICEEVYTNPNVTSAMDSQVVSLLLPASVPTAHAL